MTEQGYISNRNRTLKHLYDNGIGNNIFLAGDSHQNWVRSETAFFSLSSLLTKLH
jgi:phosphodiesterase/alkaline phosphatase D-like protein